MNPDSVPSPQPSTFAADFLWGAATAAYQIEGAAAEDGKGQSIWDQFSHTPGAVWRGHTGDIACEHYHRMPGDVALMREIGLQAYRFSIAWTRILPDGVGRVNAEGLEFYDRLVDELLAANINPFCTLYHWDYPQALQARGGWLKRESADWFAEYTEVVAKRLGDRVKNWMTLNEPQIFVTLGLQAGMHAPGLTLPVKEVLQAGHHALLAHGRAVQILRTHCPNANIGFAPQTPISFPATESAADVAAARAFNFDVEGYGKVFNQLLGLPLKNPLNNAWWLDAVFLGKYPEEAIAFYGDDAPDIKAGDMALISQPIDFFGVNIYFGFKVAADTNGMPTVLPVTTAAPLTAYDWPVTPEALYWGPRFFYERYKKPIYIMENGLSLRDWVALDGKVHDPQRVDFLTRYLRQLGRACAENIPVKGYFHWSLMDNFEWSDGYKQRFGLVHVDYDTQIRTWKDSAFWYQDVIATNGANI